MPNQAQEQENGVILETYEKKVEPYTAKRFMSDMVNVRIERMACFNAHDYVICRNKVVPVGIPAFFTLHEFDEEAHDDVIIIYVYDGKRWVVTRMPSDYSWE